MTVIIFLKKVKIGKVVQHLFHSMGKSRSRMVRWLGGKGKQSRRKRESGKKWVETEPGLLNFLGNLYFLIWKQMNEPFHLYTRLEIDGSWNSEIVPYTIVSIFKGFYAI